jgi:GDSL-like Lipase/Acylhydrolase family
MTRLPPSMIAVPYIAAVLVVWIGYHEFGPLPSGEPLNRLAWESAFRERGVSLPAAGPREGYWGHAKPQPTADPELEWREAEFSLPARVEVDARGFQSVGEPSAPRHVLILGGSVAWGAYASSIAKTYFALVADALARAHVPVRITVLAAGGWDSKNELAALRTSGLLQHPDVIVFLDGLNDLTASKRVPVEHRVRRYLRNMTSAVRLATEQHVPVALCLQPFLLQKRSLTRIEKRIVALSFAEAFPEPFVRSAYPLMRAGLSQLALSGEASFIDCSGALDGETATTFTDIWHFPDPGHALLADCLARGLAPIVAGATR